jgi:YD repeat-containing protein
MCVWLLVFVAAVVPISVPGQVTPFKSTSTHFEYDSFWNPTVISRSTGDGDVDRLQVSYNYNVSPTTWLVAMPVKITEWILTPPGQEALRTTTFVPDVTNGAIRQRTLEPDGDVATCNRTTYDFDLQGQVIKVSTADCFGGQPRTSLLQFDPVEDAFLASVTNALGQVERFAFHPGLGVPTAYQDSNGLIAERQYDTFGRIKNVLPPDGSKVSMTYPGTTGIELDAYFASGQSITTVYDPFLNELSRRWSGFRGEDVELFTSYNSQGLVSERDGPCFQASGAPCSDASSSQYSYDELGRLISVLRMGGLAGPTLRTWEYSGLKTTRYNILGQRRSYTLKNQLGQITSSVVITDEEREIPTTFAYEPFDELLSVTDAYNNITRFTHDAGGRLKTLDDPDSGNHSYQWTTFDELAYFQDGNGIVNTYVTDSLGRIKSVTNGDGVATFVWDTALNGIGKIASAMSTDGITTTYSYDAKGKLATSAWGIGSATYGYALSYDPLGRVDTVAYPSVANHAPFVVKYAYNRSG